MDKLLFSMLEDETPKMNPDIAEGLAYKEISRAKDFIDFNIRLALERLPPELKFHGTENCSPEKLFDELVRKDHRGRSNYDVSHSDLYAIEIKFDYKGEPISHVVLLPYCHRGGVMRLNGSVFHVKPVIADRVISVSGESVFVTFSRNKATFRRSVHPVLQNGVEVSGYVVQSTLHNRTNRTDTGLQPIYRVDHTMGLYLMAKFGLKGVLAKITNKPVHIGTSDQINESTFHPDRYTIFTTATTAAPRGVPINGYSPTEIRVAVETVQLSPLLNSFIYELFYVLDCFPDLLDDPSEFDDPTRWQLILSKVIYGGIGNIGTNLEGIRTHISSLDDYVDLGVVKDLKDINLDIDNTYDFLLYLIDNITNYLTGEGGESSKYDRHLTVLKYLLAPIQHGFFSFMFKIEDMQRKEAVIDADKIKQQLRTHIKTKDILSIRKQTHAEVESIEAASDNMIPKLTSRLALQSNVGSNSKKVTLNAGSSDFVLDTDLPHTHSFIDLSKSMPSGHEKINMFLKLSPSGSVIKEHTTLLNKSAKELGL